MSPELLSKIKHKYNIGLINLELTNIYSLGIILI